MEFTEKLKEIFGERLKLDEPLSKHLNFRIGGPAKWFTEVKTVEELQAALAAAKEAGITTFVLGGGSNTLANDAGFDGLVLKMAMRSVEIDGTRVAADAGVISAALARQTAQAGLKGFTWAISLPGTIGGAVRGNAGCFGGEMVDVIKEVDVLRDGAVVRIPASELKFGYRESSIKHSDDIVLRAYFDLEKGDAEVLKKELEEKVKSRKETQPLYAGSAGCMFKNYEATGEEIEHVDKTFDVPEQMKSAQRISIGWLIDQLGLKGTRIGDAEISEEHGNFIINHGAATASDVVQIIALIKERAKNELGIDLHEEVQYLGF